MSSEKAASTDESVEREYPERPIVSVAACVFKEAGIEVDMKERPPSQIEYLD